MWRVCSFPYWVFLMQIVPMEDAEGSSLHGYDLMLTLIKKRAIPWASSMQSIYSDCRLPAYIRFDPVLFQIGLAQGLSVGILGRTNR